MCWAFALQKVNKLLHLEIKLFILWVDTTNLATRLQTQNSELLRRSWQHRGPGSVPLLGKGWQPLRREKYSPWVALLWPLQPAAWKCIKRNSRRSCICDIVVNICTHFYLGGKLKLLSSSLNCSQSCIFFISNGIILLWRLWRGKNDPWKPICLCVAF